MARSAVTAGFRVSSIDAFGDSDHPHSAGVFVPGSGMGAASGGRTSRLPGSRGIAAPDADAVVYASTLENDPRAVAALARGRALWGNTQRCFDVSAIRGWWGRRCAPAGTMRPSCGCRQRSRSFAPHDAWLLKPLRSGGGRHVRPWRRGRRVPVSCYAQQYVDGVPGSVLFVAAAGQTAPLGVTRQLVGDPAFGATGFRYCGSVLCPAAADESDAWRAPAAALACSAVSAFDLVGVGGVDFIARDDVVHPIEVNPRWTSSMELVERVWGHSLFAAHADAGAHGSLPRVQPDGFVTSPARACGKAIVFARRDVRLGDTRVWLDADVADIPHPWTQVSAGEPVCTVFAEGTDATSCRAALVNRAVHLSATRRWTNGRPREPGIDTGSCRSVVAALAAPAAAGPPAGRHAPGHARRRLHGAGAPRIPQCVAAVRLEDRGDEQGGSGASQGGRSAGRRSCCASAPSTAAPRCPSVPTTCAWRKRSSRFGWRGTFRPVPGPMTQPRWWPPSIRCTRPSRFPTSRFNDFTIVGAPQLIADNACGHYFVLGPASTADWRAIDSAAHTVKGEITGRLTRDGLRQRPRRPASRADVAGQRTVRHRGHAARG